MSPLRGYDGASPAFNLAAARAHDGIVCSVYIVGSPGGMAHADKARVDAIRANGMGVLPNWERAADFFRTATTADCKAAGVEALAACRALGIPDDGTVGCAFSFDYQVPAVKYPAMRSKLAAVTDGLGGHYIPLVYAQSGLIRYLARTGFKGPHWLMASTWGLAYNPKSADVAMVQSHEADGTWLDSPVQGTDINTVTQPDRLAAWWPDGSPYGGSVPISDDDVAKLVKAVWAYRSGVKDADGDDWQMQTYLRNAKVNAGGSAKVLGSSDGVLARIAALQAANAALAQALGQANAELAALKAQGALTLQPGQEIPATVKIGAQQ